MKMLVTGAAGFIGSNFVRDLLGRRDDVRIVALDKLTYAGNLENLADVLAAHPDRFEFVKGDICDTALVDDLFATRRPDAVINFAAESHVDRSIHDPQVFLQTNILGAHVLLEAARKSWMADGAARPGAKFVQVSTDEVYGSLGATGLFTETTPLQPRSPYSASKASADLVANAYFETFGLPVCITRCSNNYGAFQFPEKLIPLMIHNALAHKELPVYGDGRQVRDWLHVADHCRAIVDVWQRGRPGEVYNVGGNNERENIEIVNLILEVLAQRTGDPAIGPSLVRHVKDRLGHDRRYAIDATKIRAELGWVPRIGFREGMEATIDWYLAHRDWTERIVSGEYQRFYELNYSGSV